MAKKILITGAGGFIGKNLTAELAREPEKYELLCVDIDTPEALFESMLAQCDFVVHLAGVNRPKTNDEFARGNSDLTAWICEQLSKRESPAPVAMTSSIQALLDNPYGKSKLAAEHTLLEYSKKTGAPVYVWRLPNVFGKWCRPNYNSAVATFCHNIARGLPITVSDPAHPMTLIYIDSVLSLIKSAISGEAPEPDKDGYRPIIGARSCLLGEIPKKLTAFRDSRENLMMPSLEQPLDRELYATYLSYLPENEFSYPLVAHGDERGVFAEIIKSQSAGQVSFSTTAPRILRGNHWHHTKNEKFLAVSGEAVIRLRKIDCDEIIEYHVSGAEPRVVDIPPGYTHNFENTSDTKELVMVIWASEPYDPEHPDTYRMEV